VEEEEHHGGEMAGEDDDNMMAEEDNPHIRNCRHDDDLDRMAEEADEHDELVAEECNRGNDDDLVAGDHSRDDDDYGHGKEEGYGDNSGDDVGVVVGEGQSIRSLYMDMEMGDDRGDTVDDNHSDDRVGRAD